ncbi:MAG TPA: hypothetical protein VGF88_05825 [Acidobacteriaceae bacterium]|jgi:hypothetical protein
MPAHIGAKLYSGFDDPCGMLHDCHRRIERFLAVLCEVLANERAKTKTRAFLSGPPDPSTYMGPPQNSPETQPRELTPKKP